MARRRPDLALAAAVFLADLVVLTVVSLATSGFSLGVVASAQVALWIVAPWRAALSPQHGAPVRRVIVSMLAAHFWCALIHVPFGAATAVLMIAAVVGERSLIQIVIDGLKARGKLQQPTLVLGSGSDANDFVEALRSHPEYGCLPVHRPDLAPGMPWSVDPRDGEEITTLVATLRVRRLFLFDPDVWTPAIDPACEIFLAVPNGTEQLLARCADDHVWGIPVIRVPFAASANPTMRWKRLFDIVGAAMAILLSAPLFLLTALAVKLSSRGPVLYRQTRVGEDGRLIKVTKFRTLRERTELNLEVVDDPPSDRWQQMQHDEARRRETKVGRVLRATSVDELPQLFDILRGELSLVGPRPELPHQVVYYSSSIEGYANRHRMRAGLTGFAQIHGLRGETSLTERARFDNFYIDTWSLGRDVAIVVATFFAVVRDALRAFSRRTG